MGSQINFQMKIKNRRGEKNAVDGVEETSHAWQQAAGVFRVARSFHQLLRQVADLADNAD